MDKQLSIEGSCNGLLCLSQGRTPNLILTLFNPCTGSISRTAPTENTSKLGRWILYGFGYDTLHDKYKFVMCSGYNHPLRDDDKMVKCGAKVCTFDANPSWKEVDRPKFPYYTIGNNHGKFFRDTLNWLMFDPTKDVADGFLMKHREWFILTFDLETESFGRLCLPVRENNGADVDLPILEVLKNCLYVSFHHDLYNLPHCLKGMLLAWENGFREVICETDNIEVYMIAHKVQDIGTGLNLDLTSKIRDLLHRNWWIEIRLIQRTANCVADAMAKTAARHHYPHMEWLQSWSDLIPVLRQDLSPL
ncbi:hypothetical protein PIB30_003125 [Stylosanthes scabra]|uniref:RNase H type-1 domain-containing protein n=1 Tax=Stylosanthes scabra TaxID=79078 RepID=A0ABU6Y1S8_9FABA|nr:hypothetical protein [Stylosanthes scabra]